MAFTQVPQGGGGFQQIHPQDAGYHQMHDSSNPAAQAYARHALAANGIHVPQGVDAAAMWRQYSAQRASQQQGAMAQGPDPYDAGVNPNQPVGGAQPYPAGPPQVGPQQIGAMLPDGGMRHPAPTGNAPLDAGLGNIADWRNRIQTMAHNLSSANARQPATIDFQHNQGGPAESALALAKMTHVNQAHQAAKNLANLLAANRVHRHIRSTPKRF